jgi:hypothetical protein
MTSPTAARPEVIRQHNLAVVLGEIHRDGSLSRAELTTRLGLSRSTIGALVAELTELRLVEELVPTGGARAGRPSHVVSPHPCGPYAIAVDLDIAHDRGGRPRRDGARPARPRPRARAPRAEGRRRRDRQFDSGIARAGP